MEIDLRYNRVRGVYLLNGLRVILLPKGGLELIQDYVANILGLATKSIFEDAMAVTIYSFLTDLIKSKNLKMHSEERTTEEIFQLFNSMGLGHIRIASSDVDSYGITAENGFNSFMGLMKPMPYCFQMGGLLTGIYRLILKKSVKVTELKCKSMGTSDIDWFKLDVLEERESYNYIPSPTYTVDDNNSDLEKPEITITDYGISINSIPTEIVPVIFFPYLFEKLKKIIGSGAYGLEYGIGTYLSKLFQPYSLSAITSKYQVAGFEVLSPLDGVGLITSTKNQFGGLNEIDVYDSFNALHIEASPEKRCFFLSGLFSGLSYNLVGTSLKLKETDCSAINNSVCKFSFQ
jgi:predicted hydrocarbon binding protein